MKLSYINILALRNIMARIIHGYTQVYQQAKREFGPTSDHAKYTKAMLEGADAFRKELLRVAKEKAEEIER